MAAVDRSAAFGSAPTAAGDDFPDVESDPRKNKIYSLVERCIVREAEPMVSLALVLFPDRNSTTSLSSVGRDPTRILPLLTDALDDLDRSRAAVVHDLCSQHASDMAQSVQDLSLLHQEAHGTSTLLQGNNQRIQASGAQLTQRLAEQAKATQVQQNVGRALNAVELSLRILRLVSIVEHRIRENRLHKALLLLEDIRVVHLGIGPCSAAGTSKVAPAPVTSDLLDLGELHAFLVAKVRDLSTEIERKSLQEFNDWLTAIRAAALGIGMRSVRECSDERQAEDALAAQRKEVQIHLMQHRNLAEAAKLVQATMVNFDSHRTTAEAGSRTWTTLPDPDGNDPFVATPKGGNAGNWNSESPHALGALPLPQADKIDMKQLYRSAYIQQCLGKMTSFQQSYFTNRKLQMMNDLAAPANFLESYQPYLAKLAGFFTVEDKVQRTAAQLMSGRQVDMLWTAAMTKIKATLDDAFERMHDPADVLRMLMVKDFVRLIWQALGKCRYNVQPLQQILISNVSKYHSLLAAGLLERLREHLPARAVAVVVNTRPQHQQLTHTLGLPSSIMQDSGLDPGHVVFPYHAPYSTVVPSLLRELHDCISDSAAYFQGLLPPGEALPAVRRERDRIVQKTVLPVLQQHMGLAGSAGVDIKSAMQTVCNVWSLQQAAPAVDVYTIDAVRGKEPEGGGPGVPGTERERRQDPPAPGAPSPAGPGEDGAAGVTAMQSALSVLQCEAMETLGGVVDGQIADILASMAQVDWTPAAPAPGNTPSEYINEVVTYMDSLNQQVTLKLPMGPLPKQLLTRSITSCGALMVEQIASDRVKAFNGHALRQLEEDLLALYAFARQCAVGGAAVQSTVLLKQLCDVLVQQTSGTPRGHGGELPAEMRFDGWSSDLLLLLSKYRDVSAPAVGGMGWSRTGTGSPGDDSGFRSKKEVDADIKAYKSYMSSAASPMRSPRGQR